MSFSKNCVFPQIWWASAHFDRSVLFFDRSKILNFDKREPLSVSIDRNETVFRSIETRETCFFKSQIGLFKGTFSKKVFKLSSLSDLAKAPPSIFCHFPPNFLQGFCPWRLVSLFCPSFCILFLVFMHCCGYFQHFLYIGFLMIQTCFGKIDQWVFVLECYNDDSCGLIWSILWFLKNWEF